MHWHDWDANTMSDNRPSKQRLRHHAAKLGNRMAHKQYPNVVMGTTDAEIWVGYAEGFEAGYLAGRKYRSKSK